MRKRLTDAASTSPSIPPPLDENWLSLEPLAEVEITSEDPANPIEAALLPGTGAGWRAAAPGPQTIRLRFDRPQQIKRIRLLFTERETERTQEFALRSLAEGDTSFREILRQQWNFSPSDAPREVEDYRVDLPDVKAIELVITPDIGGGSARASLDEWRLA